LETEKNNTVKAR